MKSLLKASLLLCIMTNYLRQIAVSAVLVEINSKINFDSINLNDTALLNTSNSKSNSTSNITLSDPLKQEKISILKSDLNFEKKLYKRKKEELAPSTCACNVCNQQNQDFFCKQNRDWEFDDIFNRCPCDNKYQQLPPRKTECGCNKQEDKCSKCCRVSCKTQILGIYGDKDKENQLLKECEEDCESEKGIQDSHWLCRKDCKRKDESECETCCQNECNKCNFDGSKCFENCKNAKNPAGIKCGPKCKEKIKCSDCCEALSSDIDNKIQRFESEQRCKEGTGQKRAQCVEQGYCKQKPCLTCCQKQCSKYTKLSDKDKCVYECNTLQSTSIELIKCSKECKVDFTCSSCCSQLSSSIENKFERQEFQTKCFFNNFCDFEHRNRKFKKCKPFCENKFQKPEKCSKDEDQNKDDKKQKFSKKLTFLEEINRVCDFIKNEKEDKFDIQKLLELKDCKIDNPKECTINFLKTQKYIESSAKFNHDDSTKLNLYQVEKKCFYKHSDIDINMICQKNNHKGEKQNYVKVEIENKVNCDVYKQQIFATKASDCDESSGEFQLQLKTKVSHKKYQQKCQLSCKSDVLCKSK